MKYKVVIAENSDYMSAGYAGGEFETAAEALAAAKAMVDADLGEVYKTGQTVDDLFRMYTTFGRDPYIVGADETVSFSAWDYARERARVMCGEPDSKPRVLTDWFRVSFDDDGIKTDVSPPGCDARHETIAWNRIVRICFKTGDYLSSDEIYIFTYDRPESYLIPTEAGGGLDLWSEIIRRGLFDAELAIKAASTTDELFCDPAG